MGIIECMSQKGTEKMFKPLPGLSIRAACSINSLIKVFSTLLYLYIYLFPFICVSDLHEYMSVPHVHVRYPHRSEEGMRARELELQMVMRYHWVLVTELGSSDRTGPYNC